MTFLDEMKVSYSGTSLKAKGRTEVAIYPRTCREHFANSHVIPGKLKLKNTPQWMVFR